MALAALFGRRTSLADPDALEEFLDRNAAFLVQKCLFEYARGRAGPFASDLFREKAFLDGLEASRWRAWPIGLGLVAEMAEGALRPVSGEDQALMLAGLNETAAAAFARYSAPLPEEEWQAAGEALRWRIAGLQLHPPKPVKDIPIRDSRAVFTLVPIHDRLKANDHELIRSHLRFTLVSIWDRFAAAADLPALAAALAARGRPPAL